MSQSPRPQIDVFKDLNGSDSIGVFFFNPSEFRDPSQDIFQTERIVAYIRGVMDGIGTVYPDDTCTKESQIWLARLGIILKTERDRFVKPIESVDLPNGITERRHNGN